jgi:hypothetical protein
MSDCQAERARAASPSAIPPSYQEALRLLVTRLAGEPVVWALTGSTSFALQGVAVPVNDIDVQTGGEQAYLLAACFPEHVLRPVTFSGTGRVRSHFGALIIAGVIVELMGGLQKRLLDGSWEEPVDVARHRRFVSLDDLSVPVLDLAYEEQAYRLLGRVERANLLLSHLTKERGA